MPVHEVRSPAVGKVLDVLVQPGSEVESGAEIVLLESMKMEVPVNAPVSGRVGAVFAGRGDHVDAGDLLLSIEA
jgi:acetyl-CoA carboxylase biotin carboxyl carrier protein